MVNSVGRRITFQSKLTVSNVYNLDCRPSLLLLHKRVSYRRVDRLLYYCLQRLVLVVPPHEQPNSARFFKSPGKSAGSTQAQSENQPSIQGTRIPLTCKIKTGRTISSIVLTSSSTNPPHYRAVQNEVRKREKEGSKRLLSISSSPNSTNGLRSVRLLR